MRWGICVLLPVCIVLAMPVSADTLLIEKVEAAQMRDLPGNGLSQSEIRERWGQPLDRVPPVGNPPIARWTYEDFIVYFERDRVISTVLRHETLANHR